MENDSRQCFRCKYFRKYYTRGVKQFNPTNSGWCSQKCATVNLHDGCDKYVFRIYRKGLSCLLRVYLNDLLTEVSELRNILEEYYNEAKDSQDV